MRERREGRVGTVSGLALLAGGTAMAAAVGGDHQTLSATLLLGTLTLGLGHSLVEEIKRQARREAVGWTRTDTTNAVLLGVWTELALVMTILLLDSTPARAVGLGLAAAYAAACVYFVTERRRTITSRTPTAATEADEAVDSLPEELDAVVPHRRHAGQVGHAPTGSNFYAGNAG